MRVRLLLVGMLTAFFFSACTPKKFSDQFNFVDRNGNKEFKLDKYNLINLYELQTEVRDTFLQNLGMKKHERTRGRYVYTFDTKGDQFPQFVVVDKILGELSLGYVTKTKDQKVDEIEAFEAENKAVYNPGKKAYIVSYKDVDYVAFYRSVNLMKMISIAKKKN